MPYRAKRKRQLGERHPSAYCVAQPWAKSLARPRPPSRSTASGSARCSICLACATSTSKLIIRRQQTWAGNRVLATRAPYLDGRRRCRNVCIDTSCIPGYPSATQIMVSDGRQGERKSEHFAFFCCISASPDLRVPMSVIGPGFRWTCSFDA